MTAAGHQSKGLLWGQTHTNRLSLARRISAPSTKTGTAVITLAGGRNTHHAEDHATLLDQRDVDGELLAAGDKFLSAIQRIDQPPAAPLRTGAQGNIGRFFGEHRNISRQGQQAVIQNMVRGHVGSRDRRRIGFFIHRHIGAPMRQCCRAGLTHQFNHSRDQRMGHVLAHGLKIPR